MHVCMHVIRSGNMEHQLTEQHREVQKWLEETFGTGNVPEYEINLKTLGHLDTLMKNSRAKKKVLSILLEDLEKKAFEYDAETKRLCAILERCGVTEDKLSADGRSALDTIAQVAGELNIRDTSKTSFVLGLNHVRKKTLCATTELKQVELEVKDLMEKKAALLDVRNTTQETLKQERTSGKQLKALTDHASKDKEFLVQKSKEYSRQIDTMKKQLTSLGYDPTISHQVLLEQSKEVEVKKARLESVNQQLSAYRDLPSDIELARLKLEEAKKELSDLHKELSQKMDRHHS